MRRITHIVIHCTGSGQDQRTEDIQNYWKNALGWRKPGYHLIVNADGTHERLAPDAETTNGVAGHNKHAIHICYKGGWKDGNAVDNRTPEQKKTLLTLVRTMRSRYPKATILGHRDFSPDRNGNGRVDRPEWIKACPSFDVAQWLNESGIKA
jgi:N-acetylmuramoyl-L-alanine amidase